jgi:hypothetical protein
MNARCLRRRSGVTAVIAVAAVVMIGLIGALSVRLVLLHRERADLARDRAQAAWLVESGLERAWARLGRDADYAGETWAIPGDQIDGRPASVRIEMAEDADVMTIRISVEFPAGPAAAVRTSKTFAARRPAGRSGDTP